jgi:hypothetical protein
MLVSNELKDTVSSLLEALANENTSSLTQILNDRMGEDFMNSYSDIINRIRVDKKVETTKQQPSKVAQKAERTEINLP